MVLQDADDLYVIHYAWSKNAHVVSNDHFRDWMTRWGDGAHPLSHDQPHSFGAAFTCMVCVRLKELSPEMPQWLKSKRVSYTFFQVRDPRPPPPRHIGLHDPRHSIHHVEKLSYSTPRLHVS
jgi:hypothetical protein